MSDGGTVHMEAFAMHIGRSLLIASLAASLTGCIHEHQDDAGDEVARAIPRADEVKINLPQTDTEFQALGQIADYYRLTRNVTRSLNGGAAWVLIVVHAIVDNYPATSVDGNVYTWGPWDEGALAPAIYRLVVTANDDGTYDWQLDGQSKTVAAAPFESVISGHAVPDGLPDDDVHLGSGDFTIDFDAGERVNPIDNTPDTGNVLVTYDLLARVVTMHAEGVDELGNPGTFDYFYDENDDGSGDFQFALEGDMEKNSSLAESALIRSRWQPTGAGRSDAMVSGGDLADLELTATECWDAQFGRTYYTDSVTWQPTEGDAGSCAYADVALPES
ncbi:MAG TPA: hypothetical protein VMZ28_28050 [Kofleriaceae bacterium]|nr:hypothetical protein [Kofleriaceae bacterium]